MPPNVHPGPSASFWFRADPEPRRSPLFKAQRGASGGLLLAAVFFVSCAQTQPAPEKPAAGETAKSIPVDAVGAASAGAGNASPSAAPAATAPASRYRLPKQGFDHQIVTIACDDGYTMAADYLTRNLRRWRGGKMPGVIFLHELGKERHQFYPLTMMSAGRGMAVLALDLRGHGENPDARGNPPTSSDELTPEDFQLMLQDIRNAISFLAIKNVVDGGRIALVGSSLGANLALIVASQSWAAAVQCVIAISPGLEYHGLKTEEAVKNIGSGVHVYLAAARDDEYSSTSAASLFKLLQKPKMFFHPETGGHGMKLLSRGLIGKIPRWLNEALIEPYRDKTGPPNPRP